MKLLFDSEQVADKGSIVVRTWEGESKPSWWNVNVNVNVNDRRVLNSSHEIFCHQVLRSCRLTDILAAFYQSVRCYNTDDLDVYTHHRERDDHKTHTHWTYSTSPCVQHQSLNSFIHSVFCLTTGPKPPHSAIQSLLLQMRISSPVLKVIQ